MQGHRREVDQRPHRAEHDDGGDDQRQAVVLAVDRDEDAERRDGDEQQRPRQEDHGGDQALAHLLGELAEPALDVRELLLAVAHGSAHVRDRGGGQRRDRRQRRPGGLDRTAGGVELRRPAALPGGERGQRRHADEHESPDGPEHEQPHLPRLRGDLPQVLLRSPHHVEQRDQHRRRQQGDDRDEDAGRDRDRAVADVVVRAVERQPDQQPADQHRQADQQHVDEQPGHHAQAEVDLRRGVRREVGQVVAQVLLLRRARGEREAVQVVEEGRVGVLVVGLVLPRLGDHAERRRDVRPAGHRRQVARLLQLAPRLELLQRAEVERGRADAAARAADADPLGVVRWLVQAAEGRRSVPAVAVEQPAPAGRRAPALAALRFPPRGACPDRACPPPCSCGRPYAGRTSCVKSRGQAASGIATSSPAATTRLRPRRLAS